jgi:hypothetical protein
MTMIAETKNKIKFKKIKKKIKSNWHHTRNITQTN